MEKNEKDKLEEFFEEQNFKEVEKKLEDILYSQQKKRKGFIYGRNKKAVENT